MFKKVSQCRNSVDIIKDNFCKLTCLRIRNILRLNFYIQALKIYAAKIEGIKKDIYLLIFEKCIKNKSLKKITLLIKYRHIFSNFLSSPEYQFEAILSPLKYLELNIVAVLPASDKMR